MPGAANEMDAGVDYAVLRNVRETWPFSLRQRFAHELDALWMSRVKLMNGVEVWPNRAMRYEVGDYSRAASAAALAARRDAGEGEQR